MTKSDFTHFVITRFNIRVSGFGPEKMISPTMDDSFLEQRLMFFQKYCVPSIHHQHSINFTWLLYFDTETDLSFFARVQEVSRGPIPIVFAFVSGYDEMLEDIGLRMRQSGTPYCITTRLDNDDVLSADYTETTQKHFVAQDRTLINFTKGFELDVTHHLIKKWNKRYKNQFTSLIEASASLELLTVYGFAHNAVPDSVRILNYSDGPKWAYTRHEVNYSPQKINARPVFSLSALDPFPSLRGVIVISPAYTTWYTWLWLQKKMKDKLMSLIRKK